MEVEESKKVGKFLGQLSLAGEGISPRVPVVCLGLERFIFHLYLACSALGLRTKERDRELAKGKVGPLGVAAVPAKGYHSG